MEEEGEEAQGGSSECSSASQRSTGSGASLDGEAVGAEEVEKMSAQKTTQIMPAADEPRWRQSIREQMESELERRVREALATPPRERLNRRRQLAKQRNMPRVDLNAHLILGLSDKEQNRLRTQRWRALQADKDAIMTYFPASHNPQVEFIFRDELSKSNQDEFPGVFGLDSFSEGIKNIREDYTNSVNRYGSKPKTRHFYTKEGFLKALRSGNLPPGVHFLDDTGRYVDKYGVVRNNDGPFWPVESVPLYPTPRFKWWNDVQDEPLYIHLPQSSRTIDNQTTAFNGRWRGTLIVYDSERSPREYNPQPVSEGCCPNLVFESRFESGNLRQARRIGMFEYELVLKTDLYTTRHTQWFFFLVRNVQPGVTYKFKIVNLLKTDSLYNYGMRPLMYSEKDAAEKQTGWIRTGHHISYTKNQTNTTCPLLSRCVHYYMLEWQMEFPNAEDTYYLAHCYPYTFTDLKDDLDVLMASPGRKAYIRREVLCESRAGNSCFLITVTNFEKEGPKKAVVVTARVHPGESQASWMMKGLLEFVTGPDPVAQELRDRFVFKMVPMLNPDGVIVGNYRCSLAARDLNRNYRHPRRENFPTIYSLKAMVEALAQKYEILVYCDLHGHSRKHNVFMYGNNTSTEEDVSGLGSARAFISERLFPWLMASTVSWMVCQRIGYPFALRHINRALRRRIIPDRCLKAYAQSLYAGEVLKCVRCPDKFSFRSCKFQIRKCKESTGRVVMWRQMNIYNSFTLEATFSGTILDRQKCRHFNIRDLMEVGKGLAETVLEYQRMQENKMKQTETVLELTKAITQQILEARGLIGPNSVLPDFVVNKNLMETEAEAVQEDAERWTEAMLTLLQQPAIPEVHATSASEPDRGQSQGQGRREEKVSRKSNSMAMSAGLSREEANKLLDRASLSTMDGCLNVLAALSVRDTLQESDSSDSDSESEPEMKPPDPKPRKKKRKSRKQRDKDHPDKKQASADKRGEEKEKDSRGKTFSPQYGPYSFRESKVVALPALLCAEASSANSQGHALSAGSTPLDSSLLTAQLTKRQQYQAARKPAPVALVQPQRCLAAEPRQIDLYGDKQSARTALSWSHPGALPSFTFKAFHVGKPTQPQSCPKHPGVSVTSQFVKIQQDDGKALFIPVRHIRRGRTVAQSTQTQSVKAGASAHSSRMDSSVGTSSSSSLMFPQPQYAQVVAVAQPSERRYSMESLAVSLQRSQPVCAPDSARSQWRSPEHSNGHKCLSASLTARPRTIRQSISFGRQISVSSLQREALEEFLKTEAGSNSVLDRLSKERRPTQFQSKYEGRHNGGVPCFTEERSLERAAKRVAEMKKKYEDDRQRDVSFVCVEEPVMYPYPTHMYPQVLTQEDFNHRLQVALNEGTANLSRTLMGMNVRTGYTHADNLQDLHPTINGNYLLAAQLSNNNGNNSANGSASSTTNASSALASPVGNPVGIPVANGSPAFTSNRQQALVDNGQEHSTSEDSDSGSEVLKAQSALPVSSRRSPYHLDMLQRAPGSLVSCWPLKSTPASPTHAPLSAVLPSPPVAKRPVRYKASQGQMQRIIRRHSSQATPPITTSSIQPISRDPPRHYDNPSASLATAAAAQSSLVPDRPHYDRPRIGRGPLIRGLRHPGIRQGYMWE